MPPDENRRKAVLVTEDSFAALVAAFMRSPKFLGYSENTQLLWGSCLKFAARPALLGAISLQEIRPSIVQGFFDGLTDTPGKQAATLAAMGVMEKWAVVRDILPRQITIGVEIEDSDGGHIPWSDEQVALAEKHARSDLARVITLGANTGQRGSDLIRITPNDIETFDGISGFNVRQIKTKREVWVPILSALTNAMRKWERRPGPYLLRLDGNPWRRKQLTEAWTYERDHNPALAPLRAVGPDEKPLVLHGLRGHACVRLVRSGANTRQVSDMVGMSEAMVVRYTRLSLQRENAMAAVINLEKTIEERKLLSRTK